MTSNKILFKINDQHLQLVTNAPPNVEFSKISFKNNQYPQSCHKVAYTNMGENFWNSNFKVERKNK